MKKADILKIEEKYLEELQSLDPKDNEGSHISADIILTELLTELGFTKVVEAYNKIGKWYA